MRTIEVTVSPQGDARVETKGFAGASCRQASQFLEQALGQKMYEQLTADFHGQSAVQEHSLTSRL